MYYLIYVSYASRILEEQELQSLLSRARHHNELLGITGMLYFFNKSFIQLIEGEESTVKELYQTILQDERHQSAVIIKEGYTPQRFYPDWSMGYKLLTPEERIKLAEPGKTVTPGYVNMASVIQLFQISAGRDKLNDTKEF